ncbi:MAG: tetratricopeptide repeat protein [Opitutales bacterium]
MYRKIIFIVALLAAASSYGQNVSQMSTTELNSELQALVSQGSWTGSRTYADELIRRFQGTEAQKATLHNLYYLRAYGNFQDYFADKSTSYVSNALQDLDEIIASNEVTEIVRKAIDLKSICCEALGNFKDSAEALGILLAPPFIYQLKMSEQLDLTRRIVNSLYTQRAWEGNEKWFTRLLNMSNVPDDKMLAASALMQCAIFAKDYDEAMKYLPYTTIDAPARYDIALNISFLNAARQLSDIKLERYADASVFYSLTYDKETIVKYFEGYKAKEEIRLKFIKEKNPESTFIPTVEGRIAMAEAQLKGLAKVEEYSPVLALGKAINYQATERMYESYWAYTQMIDAFPDSPQIEEYYFYAFDAALKIEKLSDMEALGKTYVEKFPSGKFAKNIKLQLTMFYHEKAMYDELFPACMDFIDNYNTDQNAETVVYLMASVWIMQGQFDMLIRTFDSYLRKYSNSVVVDSFHYWSGLANMAKSDYAKAYDCFKTVVDKFTDSTYVVDANYRMGISAYGNQEPELAEQIFTKFVADYGYNDLAGEAEFFLGDLCVAKGASDEALLHYAQVDEKTSNQDFIDNAYIQSIGIQNQAANYLEVIKLAKKYVSKYPEGNVALMQFEIANAMNETGQKGSTLLIYKDIILKYGNDPLLSGADKAIEKYIASYQPTVENLNATKEFIEKTLADKELLTMLVKEPGKRYRYFLENPIVDKDLYKKFKSDEKFTVNLFEDTKPLEDLLAHFKEQISLVPAEKPIEFFNTLLTENKGKNPTLEFRAMMALDKFLKAPIVTKAFNSDDYAYASPATLTWIATLNEKYSINDALSAYQYILDNYTDNQYLFEAVLGMAQLYAKNKDFVNANACYERLENEFSSDARAWQAAMSYAETLVIEGDLNLAIEKFENIRRNPELRGEAFAGALYNLGKIYESKNEVDKALNAYDNCAIGHTSFVRYSGKAALAEIKLLQKLGRTDEAKETAKAYLESASAKTADEYQDILELSKML